MSTKNVAFDALYLDGNVRTAECKRIPAMVESLRRSGFKENHPLVVSLKGDGKHLVLCGNRRTEGLQWLQDNDPSAFRRALPNDKVPCIVHKGLSEAEEVMLRIDHSTEEDRVPLDEWSLYLAIQQFVKVGFDTQEEIAEKLGIFISSGKNKGKPNRSFVQPRVNLARLPDFVGDELRKRSTDPKSTNVRWADVPKLFTVYMDEFAAYPDGNGPGFTQIWESIVNPSEEEVADSKEKALSIADAKKRAMSTSSKTLRDALLCVTGQGSADFVTLDATMVKAETALQMIENIAAYLGEKDFQELLKASAEHVAMVNEPATV